jgi:Protein of unknown function (DUF4238)
MNTNGNRAKQHHYLPACYLADFTLSGEKDGVLHVLDQDNIKEWSSSPLKVARCNGFYAVDFGPNVHPNIIEDILSRIESLVSKVIRDVVQNETLPTGEQFDWLLNFVAIQATRTPRIRSLVSTVVEKTVKDHFRDSIESSPKWHEFKKLLEEHGIKVNEEDREQYLQFVSGSDYSVTVDQTWHVQMMIEMVGELLPNLVARHWSLGIVEKNAPDLLRLPNRSNAVEIRGSVGAEGVYWIQAQCNSCFTSSIPGTPANRALPGRSEHPPIHRA